MKPGEMSEDALEVGKLRIGAGWGKAIIGVMLGVAAGGGTATKWVSTANADEIRKIAKEEAKDQIEAERRTNEEKFTNLREDMQETKQAIDRLDRKVDSGFDQILDRLPARGRSDVR